jgi:hypothetical protein
MFAKRECGCIYLSDGVGWWQLYDCCEGDVDVCRVKHDLDRLEEVPPLAEELEPVLHKLGALVRDGYAARDLKAALGRIL